MNTFLGLQIGSWADWVSGIITMLGILISLNVSLNQGKFKLDLSVRPNAGYELLYSIVNRSGFDIRAQMIALSFRKNRLNKSEFSKYLDKGVQLTESGKVLKNNVLKQETFQLATIVDEEHHKEKFFNGEIPFEYQLLRFDINKFKHKKKFFVVLEVLAQDGRIYRSRAKKVRFKDITFIDDSDI